MPFHNLRGCPLTLPASRLAHNPKQKEIVTYVEKSFIDPGRGAGAGERGFRRYADPPLSFRRLVQSRRALVLTFFAEGVRCYTVDGRRRYINESAPPRATVPDCAPGCGAGRALFSGLADGVVPCVPVP